MIPLTPLQLLAGCATGFLSAYFAYRRGKNPYFWFFIGWAFGMLGIVALFFADRRPESQKQGRPKEVKTGVAPPRKVLRGPTDKFWYYGKVEADGSKVQEGPLSRDTLERLWREGQLTEETLVWNEELTEWTKLGTFVVLDGNSRAQHPHTK